MITIKQLNLPALIGLLLALLPLVGCSALEELARLAGDGAPREIGDRWRTGDNLYGTVSATHTVGTIERGEYEINAQGYLELRYSRSLRAWGGSSDSMRVSLKGRQRVVLGTGEVINYTMSGSETTGGRVEILIEEDQTYTLRFYSDRIEYTQRSDSGHSTQRTGGGIGSDWGLPGSPIPSDGVSFSGSGLLQSPDEEGMTGRGRTQLTWSFSTTPPEDEVRIFMVSGGSRTDVTDQTTDTLVGQRVRLPAVPILTDASREVTDNEWRIDGLENGRVIQDWRVEGDLPRRIEVAETDNLLVGEPAGAVLTGSVELPGPFAGTEYELQYVQLVRQEAYQLELVGYPNMVWMQSSTDEFLLDGVYPYPSERLPDDRPGFRAVTPPRTRAARSGGSGVPDLERGQAVGKGQLALLRTVESRAGNGSVDTALVSAGACDRRFTRAPSNRRPGSIGKPPPSP